MQIRLRNVLAIGALTSGLLAGGALVANAATTSTTGSSGNTGTSSTSSSSTSNFLDHHTVVGLELLELIDRLRVELGLELRVQFDQELPQHGQRIHRPVGHAPVRVRPPLRRQAPKAHRGTGGVDRIAKPSGPHRPLSEPHLTRQVA